MNVCRAFWTGLVGLLLPLLSASPSPAAPVPDLPKNGVVRYFHYWSEYGEKTERPDGLERVRFELQRNRLYFSQGRPRPDTFSTQTDGSLNREIVPVLAGLDLADWPGQMDDSKLYDLSDSEKARLCRWHFSAVFEPEKPDALPLKVSFSGVDDGTSPKRLAAEQAIRDFFGPKVDALKAATPRRLTGLLWLEYGISYDLDVEDGIVTIARRNDGKRMSRAVYPGFADELTDLVLASGLEKHHGFLERTDDGKRQLSLSVTYDTSQRIEIIGHSGAGGTPEGFREALAPLLRAMDEALEPSHAAKALPPTNLAALTFRVSGMVLGEDVRLYERMDKGGPVLVLSRAVGYSPDGRKEAVLDAAQLAELEALLEKNGVGSWDGFKGRPRMDVLDGEGFSLSLTFRDGTQITANGENKFPADYRSFRHDLRLFSDNILGSQE
ncbi:MAG: hypothetical protein IJB29_07875 [Mailhella sp.]|nr:hypothetical protein [Mailhella sp.]